MYHRIERVLDINKADFRYFAKAKDIATISDFNKIHIGCVAIYHENIIGIGCNTNKTHPMQKYYNKFRECEEDDNVHFSHKLHAEMNCLRQLKNLDINFSKVKLYIYRIRKDRPHGMARPCPSCMAAIKDLGIREIYYTTDDGYVYEKLEKYKLGGVA